MRHFLLLVLAAASCVNPQEAALPSLRGLSAAGPMQAWASGSGGAVLRTVDGGAAWRRVPPPADAAQLDFRDLQAFGPDALILMAAGPGAASGLWQTSDAGRSWRKRLDCPWPEGFFDGLAFWDDRRGLLIGDPVAGALMILRTTDGGSTWTHLLDPARALAVPEEFAFAASGTSVCVRDASLAWIGTGGVGGGRVWRSEDAGDSWTVHDTPLAQSHESAGIFSIAFSDARHGVIVGGDFLLTDERARTAAWTEDGGRSWILASIPPCGYRSCVATLPGGGFVCTGPNGTDVSRDGGRSWEAWRDAAGAPLPGFHAVAPPFLAGSDGRAARLPEPQRGLGR